MRPPIRLGARTPALVALTALIVMLGVHIALRTNDALSPWKGAGFAMFSTIDSPGMRTVTVWANVAGVEERVSLVGTWDDASRELRALPTAARTLALARSVATSTLVRRADGNLAPATTAPGPLLAPATADRVSTSGVAAVPTTARQAIVQVSHIRVDVMRLSYDGGLMRASLLQSASADVALDG
jgi:hypothetical protein